MTNLVIIIEKESDLEEKIRFFPNKPVMIIFIIFLLIPISFTAYSFANREKIKIGIVLTSDSEYNDAEIAKEALNNFDDIFEARILDIKFNESNVRVRNGVYLNNDYFNPNFARSIRNRFDVDVVMIITNHLINNWLGDGYAIWGEANTQNAMTLLTTHYFRNNQSTHSKYIQHIALHEVLHLLGYQHPRDNRQCVMQYATIDTGLCYENKIELPYRLALWKMGFGKEFGQASFLINLSLSFFISTFIVPILITVQYSFKRFLYKNNNINQNPLIIGTGFYIFIVAISSFVATFYPKMILLFSSIFIYVIIESIYFELQKKESSNENSRSNPSQRLRKQ